MNWTQVLRVVLTASVLVVGATAFTGGTVARPAAIDDSTLADAESTDCAGTVCEVLCLDGKFNCPQATDGVEAVETTTLEDASSTDCAGEICDALCPGGKFDCLQATAGGTLDIATQVGAGSSECVGVDCTVDCLTRVVESGGKDLACPA